MKKIFLFGLLSLTLLIGCSLSPEEQRLNAKMAEAELSTYHNGLPALKKSGLNIAFREDYIKELWTDISVAEIENRRDKNAYNDLINLELWGIVKSYYRKNSANFWLLETLSFNGEFSVKIYKENKETLKETYRLLTEIDKKVAMLTDEEVKSWRIGFFRTFGSQSYNDFQQLNKLLETISTQELIEYRKYYIEHQKLLEKRKAELKIQEDKDNAARLIREKRLKAEGLRREEFHNKQRYSLDQSNKINAILWEGRNSAPPKRGEEICSYKGNKFGFVEDVSGKKIKILWKGNVANQPDGFYFGNRQYYTMSTSTLGLSEYAVKYQDEVSWSDTDSIAICSFSK